MGAMRKFYSTEWQGIQFSSFWKLDSKKIAGPDFYAAFYENLFRRYEGFHSLDPTWVKSKTFHAEFIKDKISDKGTRILSIGCGLGIIEKILIESGFVNVEVTDTSDVPLRWIRGIVGSQNIHIGFFPECVDTGKRFDYIYFVLVTYCLNNEELSGILKGCVRHLERGTGRCLILGSCYEWNFNGVKYEIKETLKRFLSFLKTGDFPRRQFWDYRRTREEYRRAVLDAGFTSYEDGFLSDGQYWIEGVI